MGTDVVVGAIILGILAIDAYFCSYLVKAEHERGAEEITRLQALHAGERYRLVERVRYLEYQLANHIAHVLKLPPPAPPVSNGPPPKPLPEVMQKFLEAIEDEEARGEYAQDFRTRLELSPNADPAGIVAEALNG